jgi:hypothetical protein
MNVRQSAPGRRIAACFGVAGAPTIVTTPLDAAELAITRIHCTMKEGGQPVILPPEDAFLVMLYLADVHHCDILPDRSTTPVKRYPKGSICLISLAEGAAICIRSDFDALAFHVPTTLFKELTREAGEPPVQGLQTCRGMDDPVIGNLGAAILPMFGAPEAIRTPLLTHVGLAFNAHLAHRYGRRLPLETRH